MKKKYSTSYVKLLKRQSLFIAKMVGHCRHRPPDAISRPKCRLLPNHPSDYCNAKPKMIWADSTGSMFALRLAIDAHGRWCIDSCCCTEQNRTSPCAGSTNKKGRGVRSAPHLAKTRCFTSCQKREFSLSHVGGAPQARRSRGGCSRQGIAWSHRCLSKYRARPRVASQRAHFSGDLR